MRVEPDTQAVTILLNDQESASARIRQLLPLVYDQLRAAAQRHMAGERVGHTLAATGLVHEAYIKLIGPREIPWQNRGHFYAAASDAMRQILLDHAKAHGRLKRGGVDRDQRTPLDEIATLAQERSPEADRVDFIALDDAIRRLEARDPRVAQVVHLKYFAGLEIAQVALALGVSERTVKNDWTFAKAWLERALRDDTADDQGRKNRNEP